MGGRRGLELSDGRSDFTMDGSSQGGFITEEEECLDPDEEDGEDDRLEEVIDECRFTFFEVTVAYEL